MENFKSCAKHNTTYKDRCNACQSEYNFRSRQGKLRSRFIAKDPKISQCVCGNYFDKTRIGNVSKNEKEICMSCARKRPLIRVYVKEIGKMTWVRLPPEYIRVAMA